MENTLLPRSLRIVAGIQLILGLSAAVGMLVQMYLGRLNLDLHLLGIPICFGLRRLSSGWRTCVLFFLWIGLLLAPVMFFLGLVAQRPAFFQLFGVRLADISPLWLSVAGALLFALVLWQYRVLTRPEIRALFVSAEGAPATQPQHAHH